MSMLARLKRYNEKRGHLTLTHVEGGQKFELERGWYQVSDEFAARLRKATRDNDPDAPELFDVATAEEAAEIDARERAAGGIGTAKEPIRTASAAAETKAAEAPKAEGKRRGRPPGSGKAQAGEGEADKDGALPSGDLADDDTSGDKA